MRDEASIVRVAAAACQIRAAKPPTPKGSYSPAQGTALGNASRRVGRAPQRGATIRRDSTIPRRNDAWCRTTMGGATTWVRSPFVRAVFRVHAPSRPSGHALSGLRLVISLANPGRCPGLMNHARSGLRARDAGRALKPWPLVKPIAHAHAAVADRVTNELRTFSSPVPSKPIYRRNSFTSVRPCRGC